MPSQEVVEKLQIAQDLAAVEDSSNALASHAKTTIKHVMKHSSLLSKQSKEYAANNTAGEHVSTAARHFIQHAGVVVNHTHEHLSKVGKHLRSDNAAERAIGAVGTVVTGALTGVVAAVGADMLGFVLRCASSVAVPATNLAMEAAIDNKVNEEKASSYWSSYTSWLPTMMVAASVVGAYAAVKSQKMARYVGSFFPEHKSEQVAENREVSPEMKMTKQAQ